MVRFFYLYGRACPLSSLFDFGFLYFSEFILIFNGVFFGRPRVNQQQGVYGDFVDLEIYRFEPFVGISVYVRTPVVVLYISEKTKMGQQVEKGELTLYC